MSVACCALVQPGKLAFKFELFAKRIFGIEKEVQKCLANTNVVLSCSEALLAGSISTGIIIVHVQEIKTQEEVNFDIVKPIAEIVIPKEVPDCRVVGHQK